MSNQFLDNSGLTKVLQSVNQKIADGAKSVFKTDIGSGVKSSPVSSGEAQALKNSVFSGKEQ